MKIFSILLVLFSVLVLGCSGEKTSTEAPADAVVHDAMCGCSIEGIGECGNYVSIDGEWIPIEHPSFGPMEWCANKDAGARIKIAGEVKDGKYVATYYERVD